MKNCFTNTINVDLKELVNNNSNKILQIQNFRVFQIDSGSPSYPTSLCGVSHTETRTFESPYGSQIYQTYFSGRADDTLQILVNGEEIYRSDSDLWHDCSLNGMSYCRRTQSQRLNLNKFLNGTNTITFINRNRNSSSCYSDGMSMHVTFYVYYK